MIFQEMMILIFGLITIILCLSIFIWMYKIYKILLVSRSDYREYLFHFIMDNVSVSFYCKDVENDFRYINCNPLCKEFFGRELISFTDFDILPRELAEQTRARDESLLLKPLGTVAFFEEEGVNKNGDLCLIKTYKQIICTHSGSRILLGIGFDMTEEIHLKKQNEEKEILFQGILNNIPVGIVVRDIDDHFRYIYWNSENERLTGIPRDKVLGKQKHMIDSVLFDAPTSSLIKEDDEDVLRKNSIRVERNLPLLNGEKLHLDIYKKVLKLSDGRRILIDIIRDITREKETEQWNTEKLEYQKDLINKSYLVNDGLRFMLEEKDPDRVINYILKHFVIGESADRGYIFIFKNEKHDLADCYYEWVANDIPSLIPQYQTLDLSLFPNILAKLELLEEVIWKNTDENSFTTKDQKFLNERNLRSLVLVPLRLEGKLTGFIGLDYIKTGWIFSEADIRTLNYAARLVELAYYQKVRIASILKNKNNSIDLFDAIPFPLLIFSPLGRLIRLNKQAVHYLSVFEGLKLNTICPQKLFHNQNDLCPVYETIQDKKRHSLKIQMDNEKCYLMTTYPLLDDDENVLSIVAVIDDLPNLQEADLHV